MSDNTTAATTPNPDDLKLIHNTERCVESVLKKTTYGALAPLGLLLFTSKLKVVGTFMVFGAGIGLGMGVNDCTRGRMACRGSSVVCPRSKQANATTPAPSAKSITSAEPEIKFDSVPKSESH
ncbi:hypothetical protein SAMD00019534_048440 [Acytostelium subglobosum LB1]|uniref:hypothetical protein n=1 Tax=Acytostelium subglobosum LB1 TaxID=1410327 RepID=UPI000644A52B|nr:hypothetical protein SAMD00019534_048440 [Acytostelium subglobosum LB1]GAM21669.1 hypothetical protein SAMD00019534_048440 [Acytostelium subglobosum LB1]|eukprot:XP_012755788.1 hypothetical protein SAMD00019534_048440 [Acytostelium subglobosum LB1]